MLDSYNREINYLRVSVTDRCNLRCRYCMPADGIEDIGHDHMLSLEQIAQIVKIAASGGIRKVRLTGGEPLVRKGIIDLVRQIKNNSKIEEISLTTNGILFTEMADELQAAGLSRVNFSLDTLQDDKFSYITRLGKVAPVKAAIEKALSLSLNPVKVNVVVMKGVNDNEILDFVQLAKELPLHIRFIEFMPIGDLPFYTQDKTMSVANMRDLIEDKYEITKRSLVDGNGPAKSFNIINGKGSIGFISAMSDHFCSKCNRLRLTADGKLRACLYSNNEINLKMALDNNASDDMVLKLIQRAVKEKPNRHHMEDGWGNDNKRKMYQIGG